MITYNVDGVKMPKIKKRDTSAWIRKVAASHGRKVGEIGYMFVDDEKILEVNNEYRSIPCVPMPSSLAKPMMMSFTVSSSMAFCTSVALMTRALESAKSWRRTRTRHSPCSRVLLY